MGKMGGKQDIFITSDNLHKGFKNSVKPNVSLCPMVNQSKNFQFSAPLYKAKPIKEKSLSNSFSPSVINV